MNGIFWFGYGFVYGLVLRKDTSQRKVSGVMNIMGTPSRFQVQIGEI
jgi:hypothetical protein